jgi:hypothetical protein
MMHPAPATPHRLRPPAGWRDAALIMATVVASGAAALIGLPGPAAGRAEPLAVVFAPWVPAGEAAARSIAAGHRIMRSGAASFVVVVAPPESAGEAPGRPDGALLMLRLASLAGCLLAPDID